MKATDKKSGRRYDLEYENYQGSDEQKKRRAQRNKDRREAERNGSVHKGDGRDIHHSNKTNLKNPKPRDKSNNRSDNGHKKGETQNRC